MGVLSKVKMQASDCFEESVPLWFHNSFRLTLYTKMHIYRKFNTYMPNFKVLSQTVWSRECLRRNNTFNYNYNKATILDWRIF